MKFTNILNQRVLVSFYFFWWSENVYRENNNKSLIQLDEVSYIDHTYHIFIYHNMCKIPVFKKRYVGFGGPNKF